MRVEKVYKPNWADKMAGYILVTLAGLPVLLTALVCTVFSKYYNEYMKEAAEDESK